ncbi:DUF1643 domain-containing protein [Pacificoceanicola onchidii]|uniref:DUF1643 domain-containing protein n=1 Tax=Pacificoceanicola onchidii TaxID=2562685 RepID=UPI0010A68140|nr:DUF1643 domain-containing protein [Pacificoceanicola onchidii]
MIEKRAERDGERSLALFSECERYRYGLSRTWDETLPSVLFIMLNPSTADELRNDPTIERCQRRAQALGYGSLLIANLFAWRATKPEDLRKAKDPVGPENDGVLQDWGARSDMIIAAWGVHGALLGQAERVAPLLTGDVRHLGLTKAGHPRHPLYVSYSIHPQKWPKNTRYAV